MNPDIIFEKYAIKKKQKPDSKMDSINNFIMNAIEDGWSVKKREESYIFSKKHEGCCQIFHENYLNIFIKKYYDENI
jgi:hypothetical protein